MIGVSQVVLGPEVEELVLSVLRSGQLAQGPMVARLEELMAEVTGATHAVAVNNGTTALVAAMQAAGLRPGDEVVTSPFTFIATLNAALEAGATVRFADIRPDFTLDPEATAAQIGDRTRALVPVHLYGLAADMPAFEELARQHELVIVEDAAQAHGATIAGRGAGSFGLGCFSFYATKNVTTGEGGVVTTNDDELADRLRLLRNQGMRARYQYEIAGHNYRMTDLQAAIAIPQLQRLKQITEARGHNAARLGEGLADVPGLVIPLVPEDRGHVWHQYTVRVTEESRLTRDELATALAERGVGSGIYYPRLAHDYECYAGHPQVVVSPTPVAERATREVLSLPVHPALSDEDLDRVVEAVREALGA
jgi:perosamine synthetase